MTRMLQGIAIIFMIIHHLPASGINGGEPLVTSLFGRKLISDVKICVGIYTFLIGFGYCFTANKDYRTSRLRIVRFLRKWWGLFFLIFLPVGLALGTYKPAALSVIYNAFGLREDLNWYSWFVYVYLYAMLVMPLFSRIIDRRPLVGSFALMALCFAVEFSIHMIPGWADNELLHALFSAMLYSPVLIAGYAVARLDLLRRAAERIHSNAVIAGSLIFIISMFCRSFCSNILGFNLDTIYAPLVCFGLMLMLSTLPDKNFVRKMLLQLGTLSLYMWFLHSLFFCTSTNAWFLPLIESLPSIALIFLVVFALTWGGAATYEFLERKVSALFPATAVSKC